MKRILIVSLILIILVTGCNGSSSDITEAPDITIKPDIEEGGLPNSFMDADHITFLTEPYLNLKYFEVGSWQEYMLEKHDLEIYLSYGMYRGNSGGYDTNSIYILNYNHRYPFFSGNDASVIYLSDPDTMVDLTPYYEKYGWDKFTPQEYIDKLTINNKIFAVPSVTDKYVIPRYYNKNILEELSLEVPTTINTFHEFLQASKQMNDSESFYPMVIHHWVALPSLSDIFRSYGSYVNSQTNLTMAYDPNTGSFEDAVYSDGFADALGFIRSLQNEGLLAIIGEAYDDESNNHYIGDITKVDKEMATEYYRIYDSSMNFFNNDPSLRPEYDYKMGYYLTHTNTKNVCELRSNMAFYMFPQQIDNIYGTIDLFNTVMTEPKFMYDLNYGMEESNYTFINGDVVPVEPSIGDLLNIRQIYVSKDSGVSLIPESLQYLANMKSELIYEKNVFNYWRTYDFSTSSSMNVSMTERLLYPFISVEDAIEQYKKDFISWGNYDKLEDINYNCGTSMQYDYGN